MKLFVLAVALSVGAGSAALAADLPPPMAPPPPRAPATYIPAPIPFYNWTGFYVGGNVGYGFSSSSTFSDTAGSNFTSTTSSQFLGGGQVGVNWEFGPGVVIGAEADFDWLPNAQNTLSLFNPPGSAAPAATATINNRWLTLVDARLGYAWDRFMLYGKGGGAFVGTSNSGATITATGTSVGVTGPSSNSGWTAGVGVEWAFAGNWSAKAEYDYVRLNSASYTVASTAPAPLGGDTINSNNRVINLVTVGLNYKFGPWW